ncbi:MAG: type IV secretion system protein, partial [Patescibacteria group bacterium]
VAALLVNFSLVIAGGFIEFSHIFANFFINEATPTIGGTNNGMLAFAENLTNSLAPQKLLQVKDVKELGVILKKVPGDAAIIIISVVFIFVFTFLSALVFLAIAIMLLIRFVALGILLILAPIVWLFWIFPATKHLWNQWWEKFLRWTFFAPVMLFFLYLVIKTTELKAKYFTAILGDNKLPQGPQGGDIAKIFNDYLVMRNPAQVIGEMVIIIGLMVGGLIVANKMSISFSSTALGWAQNAGKRFGAQVGGKAKQYGTAPLRAKLWKDEEGKRTKSFGEKSAEWANKNWLTRHTLGYAARGITHLETTGGENVLKQHVKAAGNMSDADLKASTLTASGPRKIAVMKELQKRKLLGDTTNAKDLISGGNQSLFGRFRQGVSWGDIEHGAKMDVEMAKQLRETGSVSAESIEKFVKTYKGKDIEQSAIKDLYSGKAKLGLSKDATNELGIAFARALAKTNYQMVPKIIPSMNAKERDNFSSIYNLVEKTEEAEKAWKNTMNNFAMGFSAETPTTGTTPPPPTT